MTIPMKFAAQIEFDFRVGKNELKTAEICATLLISIYAAAEYYSPGPIVAIQIHQLPTSIRAHANRPTDRQCKHKAASISLTKRTGMIICYPLNSPTTALKGQA